MILNQTPTPKKCNKDGLMILVVNRTEKNVSICVSKRPLSYGVCRFIACKPLYICNHQKRMELLLVRYFMWALMTMEKGLKMSIG